MDNVLLYPVLPKARSFDTVHSPKLTRNLLQNAPGVLPQWVAQV